MFEKTMTPYQYTYQNPIKFADPTGMEGEVVNKPDDWYWNAESKRIEWHNSTAETLNVGGADLLNVGSTTSEVLNNIGAVSSSKRVLDYTVGVSWEEGSTYYRNGKEVNSKGIPVPQGTIFGVLNVNTYVSPNIKTDKKGNQYFDSVITTINTTYSYNTDNGQDPGLVWSTVKTPKSLYNLPIEKGSTLTRGEGPNYTNYPFKTLAIEYNIDNYIMRKPMSITVSAGFTDVDTNASRTRNSLMISNGGNIKMSLKSN